MRSVPGFSRKELVFSTFDLAVILPSLLTIPQWEQQSSFLIQKIVQDLGLERALQ